MRFTHLVHIKKKVSYGVYHATISTPQKNVKALYQQRLFFFNIFTATKEISTFTNSRFLWYLCPSEHTNKHIKNGVFLNNVHQDEPSVMQRFCFMKQNKKKYSS